MSCRARGSSLGRTLAAWRWPARPAGGARSAPGHSVVGALGAAALACHRVWACRGAPGRWQTLGERSQRRPVRGSRPLHRWHSARHLQRPLRGDLHSARTMLALRPPASRPAAAQRPSRPGVVCSAVPGASGPNSHGDDLKRGKGEAKEQQRGASSRRAASATEQAAEGRPRRWCVFWLRRGLAGGVRHCSAVGE